MARRSAGCELKLQTWRENTEVYEEAPINPSKVFFSCYLIEQSYNARVNSAEPQFLESHFTVNTEGFCGQIQNIT